MAELYPNAKGVRDYLKTHRELEPAWNPFRAVREADKAGIAPEFIPGKGAANIICSAFFAGLMCFEMQGRAGIPSGQSAKRTRQG